MAMIVANSSSEVNNRMDEQTTKKLHVSKAKRRRRVPYDSSKYLNVAKIVKRRGLCNSDAIRLTSVPAEITPYIHPGYRHLTPCSRIFRNIVVKRNAAARIRNRILYYFPFPRVFPCLLNTRHLNVIRNHECKMRKPRDFDPENEQRIIIHGILSRARDAMAVVERLPNPQCYDVSVLAKPAKSFTPTPQNDIPSLKILCIESVRQHFQLRDEDLVKEAKEETRRKQPERCLCMGCGLDFPNADEYFDHLAEEPMCLRYSPRPLSDEPEVELEREELDS